MSHLRIGSRGSQLALWQATHVAELLRAHGHTVQIEVIKTTGDRVTEVPLAQVGTKGMFTKEIEEALLDNIVDLAVHSLKDLPTSLEPQFALAAVMKREDPRDAFLSIKFQSMDSLPGGAVVGTSSLRRQAQLRGHRPGLRFQPLRGNVDTRLKKLEAGECDAIILAASGLIRLRRLESVRQVLEPEVMCPAAGQGALAIEIRTEDRATFESLRFLDHEETAIATQCERAVLNALGGGCQVPIGAYAHISSGVLHLQAVVAHPDGTKILRHSQTGDGPVALGAAVGAKLLAMGAQSILDDVYDSGAVAPTPP